MLTKVLVFESDPAFAGELRAEFGNLGCTTTVVDDGNVGLHQAVAERPDLILLSIELPRMNGFSVCNKLKKDATLKDVPLIIMSSESNDETFEQHKKLRTRAEDYVHKPIAFGQLLEHIRAFVPVPGVQETEGAIVIDDEIEVGSDDYLLEQDVAVSAMDDDDDNSPTGAHSAPPRSLTGRPPQPVDEDVDAFTESAFGRLTTQDVAFANPSAIGDVRAPSNGSGNMAASDSVPPLPPRASLPPLRPISFRPAPGVDAAEHDRLKAELALSRERLDAAERELDEANREVGKLRVEASDSTRLMREIDELRSKLATASKGGGVSSREFLDLREGLNKKDKEILAFREQLSRKDREMVEAQDRALALERGRADVEERLLAVERELAEARDMGEAVAAERDAAKRAGDEFRGRLERARSEGDARERQLSELRAKQADDRLATEAKLAAVRADADQLLANERAEQARALDLAEQRRGADLEHARRDRDAALREARDQAERERQEALSVQFAELRQEHEGAAATLRRTHGHELDRVRTDAVEHEKSAVDGVRAKHADELLVLTQERDARISALEAASARERSEALDRVAQVEAELGAARENLRVQLESKRATDDANAAQIAQLTHQLTLTKTALDDTGTKFASASERLEKLQADVEAVRFDLAETRERLAAEISLAERARTKEKGDRLSLERAKDALAVALAQIEETENSGAA